MNMGSDLVLSLGKYRDRVNERLERWQSTRFVRRMWGKDPALWHPESPQEITDRLGWLFLPEKMQDKCGDILSFAHRIKEEGFSHVLLLGMGGSSLAPEVFQKTFGNEPGFPELIVLDSTHPAAIIEVEKKLNPASTLVLVSSKSGTTLETSSLFRYFWSWISSRQKNPGRYFVAITDEGSPFEGMAREKKFRSVFLPYPDVGGRFSAFTEFGLVPAALIGMDIQKLLDQARAEDKNSPGFILGAALGELALKRDKLTIWATPSLAAFPLWLEQLIAESTGKKGKGIVPVVDEPMTHAENYGQDRVFVGIELQREQKELEAYLSKIEASGNPAIRIVLKEKFSIGREIFRWEIATASAGAVIGVHPFNQPDVQLAKDLTQRAMKSSDKNTQATVPPTKGLSIEEEKAVAEAVHGKLTAAKPGDYIALQAYLPPSKEIVSALTRLRAGFLKSYRLATTLGFGPRFLHSTGQLHKGGPNTVLAIQITDRPEKDIPVPGTDYTFATLIEAQARGDYQALQRKDRRTLRISLGEDVIAGLKRLEGLFY